MGQISKTVRSALSLYFFLLLAYFSHYALNLVVAQYFSPIIYGDFSIVLRVLLIAAPVFLQGGNLALIVFVPNYLKNKFFPELRGYLRWTSKNIFYSFLIALFAAGIALLMVYLPFRFHELNHIVWYSLWLVPLFAIMTWLGSLMRAIKLYIQASLTYGTLFAGLATLLILFIFRSTGIASLPLLIYVIAFSCLIVILVQLVILFLYFPREGLGDEIVKKDDVWRKKSMNLLLVGLLGAATGSIDLILLELLAPQESDVGLFSAIMVIVEFVYLIITPFNVVLSVEISENMDNLGVLQKTVNHMNVNKVIFATLIFFTIFYFRFELLGHFGPEYLRASGPLVVVLLTACFCILTSSSKPFLMQTDETHYLIKTELIDLVGSVVLGIFLIPHFGLYGVAIGAAVVIVIARVMRVIRVRKVFGIKSFFFT